MKNLIIFTRVFPYHESCESFLFDEIEVLSSKAKIQIVPFEKKKGAKFNIPSGVEVNDCCVNASLMFKLGVMFTTLCSKIFWRALIEDDFLYLNFKKKVYYLKMLYGAFFIARVIKENKVVYNENSIFYSYWLTYVPLGLSMLKDKKYIQNKIISRAHGYEIYEEDKNKRKDFYKYPLRKYTYGILDEIYSISDMGTDLLHTLHVEYKNKFKTSRLGVDIIKNKSNTLEDNKFTIVSCSTVYPLKRVNLIFTSLCKYAELYCDLQIEWFHIGTSCYDNDEGLNKLINDTKMHPKNLKTHFFGNLSQNKIKDFYRQSNINLFINLSTSEGIPVSIMEAISAMIPIVATDVGGTSEVVTAETGVLLKVDFDQEEFNSALNKIIVNYDLYSKSIHDFFINNYYKENNYNKFFQEINSL